MRADIQILVVGDQVNSDKFLTIPHCLLGFDRDLTARILEINFRKHIDLVVFDLHPQMIPIDLAVLLDRLRETSCRLVAIDGLLQFRSKLDLIFLPSFLFVPPSDLQEGAPIIYGWDCFFLNIQEKPLDWKTGPKVLALTGGGDVSTLGKTWPILLDKKLPLNSELCWITGPFAKMPDLPQAPRIQIKNHKDPASLGPFMSASNYAVTVFGVSFFELLYLGIPTVVFSPYKSKDQLELKEISKLGLALVAENEIEATELLLELMNDESLARRLSLRSRAILSNSGANRLCLELANLN